MDGSKGGRGMKKGEKEGRGLGMEREGRGKEGREGSRKGGREGS